jgi:HlyD family secretion protein
MEAEEIKDEANFNSPLGVGGNIELRSEEVQEILSRPPHALIRYGISIICGVIIVLFIGSFFFRYPDIVQGDIVITTENPPVWLVAKSTGKLKELLCSDKQEVKQGDILAVIENSASTADILYVDSLLNNTVISDSVQYIPDEYRTKSFELGDIQSSYSSFSTAAINYTNFITLNLSEQEKNSLKKQITDRVNYLNNLRKQLEMKKKELKIAGSDFEREKKLYHNKIISEYEMENAEQIYLGKQQEVQQFETSIALEKVQSSQINGSVEKLDIQYQQDKNQFLSTLKSTYRELLASIEKWKQMYLLISTQNGNVTFNTFWKRNQFVTAGDKVFAIVSRNPGQLIGKIKVSSSGSGKVQIGQWVNIRVSGYPYLEYGLLQAKTKSISLVSNNDFYSVEVDFPKGLHSTVNKELKFTGEMTGAAEILTDNRSLIEYIFRSIPTHFRIETFQFQTES